MADASLHEAQIIDCVHMTYLGRVLHAHTELFGDLFSLLGCLRNGFNLRGVPVSRFAWRMQ